VLRSTQTNLPLRVNTLLIDSSRTVVEDVGTIETASHAAAVQVVPCLSGLSSVEAITSMTPASVALKGDSVLAHADLLGRSRECAVLDELVGTVRRGEGRSLLLRGEAGTGKSALLQHLVRSAPDLLVLEAAGAESEAELAYASLHQLCGPLLDQVERLPDPQREALEIVFGLRTGTTSRFLVALAVLSLLSEVADERPLMCVVDDAQWLDQTSALALGFAARRLRTEPLGLVFAAREPGYHFRHLPKLEIRGLADCHACALLSSAVRFRLDERLRDRIVAETRGNPMELLELARSLNPTELAGFTTTRRGGVQDKVDEGFQSRIGALPEQTRRLLLIAACDPLGESSLVWPAAELLGISAEAAEAAVAAGLCEFGRGVRFRHPLVRAAAYDGGSQEDRRLAHAAIAEVMNGESDPDRRAWHRALAAVGPDDTLADELERSADRARARGGQLAVASFLERSYDLTLDPARRATRAIAAAEAKFLAGSRDDALRLVGLAAGEHLDEVHLGRVDVLRGQLATSQRRVGDAPPLLLGAARRIERFNSGLARNAYRDAFIAAIHAGRFGGEAGLLEIAASIQSAPRPGGPPSLTDTLLDAAARLASGDWERGACALQGALVDIRGMDAPERLGIHWLCLAGRMSEWLWDGETWDSLSRRTLDLVRDGGTFALLPMAAATRIGWQLLAGDLGAATALAVEQEAAQGEIGGEPSPGSRIALAAFRGHEDEVRGLDEEMTRGALARGDGAFVALRHWSTAVLCNGLGRYDGALVAAQLGAEYPADIHMSSRCLSELVEAAARSGQTKTASDALGRLSEMARACGTDWILGVEARARALVAEHVDAEGLHRLAIKLLQRTHFRAECARAHLLYGEWLRRENRRVDARAELRVVHDQFTSMGMEAFAERARGELLATGETARKRTVETRDDLTAQELQIAELAREGLTNPEIGARLFLSPRTIEWHLRKAFGKLGIRSRHQLRDALAGVKSELVQAGLHISAPTAGRNRPSQSST
jgi:DNA-binding CsgD family transcriptional regulator